MGRQGYCENMHFGDELPKAERSEGKGDCCN